MIELRWLTRRMHMLHPAMNALDENGNLRVERVLQYRTWAVYLGADGNPVPYREAGRPIGQNFAWTEWMDVPEVHKP